MADDDGSVEFHQRALDVLVRNRPPRRQQSRARRGDRADAAVDRATTSTRPCQAATRGIPRLERDAAGRARARTMFKFRQLLDEHFEELARIVTTEHGKTLDESRGSVRRGIECVEVACGAPSMLMGYGLENVVDRHRLPSRCASRSASCAAIAPFNFPAMVPLWFLPFAVAMRQHVRPEAVRAGAAVAAADLRAARAVRPAAGRREPRARRQGGRRSHLRSPGHPGGVVRRIDAGGPRTSTSAPRTPASACRRSAARRTSSSSCPTRIWTSAIPIISESFYGCAGERCLAGSVLVPVGEAHARSARPAGGGRGSAQGRRRPRAGRHHGPGDQRAAQGARARLRRAGRQGRREAGARRPRRARCRRETGSSSARRSSTTSRRR